MKRTKEGLGTWKMMFPSDIEGPQIQRERFEPTLVRALLRLSILSHESSVLSVVRVGMAWVRNGVNSTAQSSTTQRVVIGWKMHLQTIQAGSIKHPTWVVLVAHHSSRMLQVARWSATSGSPVACAARHADRLIFRPRRPRSARPFRPESSA